MMMECGALFFCNEELAMGDWAKGPAGTGVTDWTNGSLGITSVLTGQLCTGWEVTEPASNITRVTFHIRPGIHWQSKAPANGREFTAQDAAWSLNRAWFTQGTVHSVAVAVDARPLSITATDKYTLVCDFKPNTFGTTCWVYTAAWNYMICPDVITAYGNMKDWRNLIGTGPFMLTDYVQGSSLTYVKNPNYWQKDPMHPENQLPYIDTVKQLIIVDVATQETALRTGKIDMSLFTTITLDTGVQLVKENPAIKYKEVNGSDKQLYFRCDKPELATSKLLVRQALTLALDKQDIVKNYWSGHAWLLGTPYPPLKTWEPFYMPMDKMPTTPQVTGSQCTVAELFGAQNIEKAKKLLTDAGYPNGFSINILSQNSLDTDFLSVIKAMFSKVNVTLNIDQKELTTFRSMRRARSYDNGIYDAAPTASFPYDMHSTRYENFDDLALFSSPITDQIYAEQRALLGRDDAKWAAKLQSAVPFILESCVGVWVPTPQLYRMWWPWVENYHGEGSLGIDDQCLFTNYVWLNSDLKRSMGY